MLDGAAVPTRHHLPLAQTRASLARNAAVLSLLAGAVAIRLAAEVAIYPGIWFSDSNPYIRTAATGILNPARTSGYSLVVAPFRALGSAGALIVFQHLLGVAFVVALYALLRRRGVGRLVAALAVAPAALDAYLVAVEHAIMSDTVFHAAVIAVVVLLMWSDDLSPGAAAAAGLLLGVAAVVRTIGLPFVVATVAYLLIRRVGWRRLALFVVGCAVVVGGYAGVFKAQHGTFALTQWGGRFLYARTAPFADCARMGDVPANQRSLCPDPAHRLTVNDYLWSSKSPIYGLPPAADGRIRSFAVRVVRHEPLRYARVVVAGVAHYFEPGHRVGPEDYSPAVWQFPADPSRPRYPGYRGPIRPSSPHEGTVAPQPYVDAMAGPPRTNAAWSRALRSYQRVVYTPGPLLALCLLAVVAALVRRSGAWRLRLDAAWLATVTLLALATAVGLSVFSYRYGLIAVLLLPPAAALAVTALRDGRGSSPAADAAATR